MTETAQAKPDIIWALSVRDMPGILRLCAQRFPCTANMPFLHAITQQLVTDAASLDARSLASALDSLGVLAESFGHLVKPKHAHLLLLDVRNRMEQDKHSEREVGRRRKDRLLSAELALLLQAFQRLGANQSNEPLVADLILRSTARMQRSFRPHEIGQAAVAVAYMGSSRSQEVKTFFQTVVEVVVGGVMQQAQARDWARLLFGLGKAERYDRQVFEMGIQAVLNEHQLIGRLSCSDWCNAAAALASIHYIDTHFVAAFYQAMLNSRPLTHGSVATGKQIAELTELTLTADDTMGHDDSENAEASAGEPGLDSTPRASGLVEGAKGTECAGALYAIAHFSPICPAPAVLVDQLISRLLACAVGKARSAPTAYDIALSLWSLVVLDRLQYNAQAAEKLLSNTRLTGMPPTDHPPQQLSQLWYVHVEAQRQGLAGLQLQGPLLRAAQTSQQRAAEAALQAAGKSSLERPVQRALQALAGMSMDQLAALQTNHGATGPQQMHVVALDILPVSGFLLEDSRNLDKQASSLHHPSSWLLPVDFILTLTWTAGSSSQQHTAQLALEADGPSHFVENLDPPRYDASTLLRNRWLRQAMAGFVATVPYYEWSRAEKQDDAGVHTYLLHKISGTIQAAESVAKTASGVKPKTANVTSGKRSKHSVPVLSLSAPPAALPVPLTLQSRAVQATSDAGDTGGYVPLPPLLPVLPLAEVLSLLPPASPPAPAEEQAQQRHGSRGRNMGSSGTTSSSRNTTGRRKIGSKDAGPGIKAGTRTVGDDRCGRPGAGPPGSAPWLAGTAASSQHASGKTGRSSDSHVGTRSSRAGSSSSSSGGGASDSTDSSRAGRSRAKPSTASSGDASLR